MDGIGEKMKYSQAENLAIALNLLLDVKGSCGLKIARNLRMINDELREYYQFKAELFKKYGEEKDGQLIINKDDPNFPLFMKELNELDQDVDFNFRKITEEELIESGLTAKQMSIIWEMVE